jgi:hypothetical protein
MQALLPLGLDLQKVVLKVAVVLLLAQMEKVENLLEVGV